MRTWPALEVTTPSDPEILQGALVDFPVAAIDDNSPDAWVVFFHTAAERDDAHRALAGEFPNLRFTATEVADEDWAARSQAGLRAIRVGDIVVAPPWDVPAEPGVSRTIVIQPSMGFGTGHHATTRLCLRALQRLELRGRSALDVGTGSGVLAIAASLMGAAPVVGIDDDPDAIQAARENAGMNAGTSVELRVADLRSATLAPADFVTANLTGGLLIQAAARLQDVTAPGGRLVLSGFMRHEADAVLDAFCKSRRASFKEDTGGHFEEDEWVCVTLVTPSSS